MKITDLKVFIVGNPPPGWGGRYFTFVKLTTDNGITGIGECYCATFGPKAMTAMIEDTFGRYVLGMDPFHIESLWRKVYGSGYTLRPDVSLMGVLSGIEIALWDIIGKSVGKPVYELLGGRVHEKLRSYTYIYPDLAKGQTDAIYWNAEASAERAAHYAKLGFTGIKFDPAAPYSSFDPRQPSLESMELCAKFCKLIREAVGTKADLLFGTHGQFTAAGAIRFAKHIEPYDPLWFEEPTPPEKPEEMALVARGTSIPIATGERLTTKYEFGRVLECRAASILQMALGRVGGIWEAKKIAGMAETYYAQIAPHLYAGPVEAVANIHFATSLPNFLILESIETFGGFYAKLLKKPIRWEQGYVIPPTEPGLGIELNEDVALAHPYTGDRLHLEMTNHPGQRMKYGYIGLGNLGGHLAASLLRNGFDVTVNDIDKNLSARHLKAGGKWADTPKALAEKIDCVITCLPSPAISENVLTQVLEGLKPGSTWIEMSTLGRDEIQRLAKLATENGVRTLEAPVTGGVHLAAQGKITVLAGGDMDLFELHKSALQAMGGQLFHMGPLGAAAIIKVITNMLAFIHLVADGEALMLAKRGGLDLAQSWAAIKASSGTSFVHETEGQLILNGSYDIAFTMDLALKDLGFAMNFGREFGVPLDLAKLTNETFIKGKAAYGGGAQSTQIVKLLEDALATDLRAPGFPARLV